MINFSVGSKFNTSLQSFTFCLQQTAREGVIAEGMNEKRVGREGDRWSGREGGREREMSEENEYFR